MKRWKLIVVTIVVCAGLGVVAAYQAGVRILREKVVDALGPGSRLAEIKINWFSIELRGLSIDGPKGWPAARTLEADLAVIFPDLRTLLSRQVRIASILIEKPYLSVLRRPGKLVIAPSLTERDKTSRSDNGGRSVLISRIELKNGRLDLYDATVSRPPYRTRIEGIDAVITNVAVPSTGKTHFDLTGTVKGVRHDGRGSASGWVTPAAKDSSSHVVLAAVDLVALQPYLLKKTDARIAGGTLDLDMVTEVRNNDLNGQGKVILRDLTFASSANFFDTFMGLPRNAVVSFLKDHNNAIDVDFTITGDTRNPNFSLNENLSTRIAAGMADRLGVSVTGVAEGLGSLGQKGLEGAGSMVQGLGAAVKRLFGGEP